MIITDVLMETCDPYRLMIPVWSDRLLHPDLRYEVSFDADSYAMQFAFRGLTIGKEPVRVSYGTHYAGCWTGVDGMLVYVRYRIDLDDAILDTMGVSTKDIMSDITRSMETPPDSATGLWTFIRTKFCRYQRDITDYGSIIAVVRGTGGDLTRASLAGYVKNGILDAVRVDG